MVITLIIAATLLTHNNMEKIIEEVEKIRQKVFSLVDLNMKFWLTKDGIPKNQMEKNIKKGDKFKTNVTKY